MILATSCKKDNNTDDPTQSGTVKDIDGNVYTTVTIGTQVWMVENLKVTKYRNGDPIPNVTDDIKWNNLTTGAQCNYMNDIAIGNKYGKLYNWYAVNDSRNLAPIGWHVPSDAEWTTLEIYISASLGTSGSIAKAMATKTDWLSSNIEGAIGNDLTKNDSSGFSALPAGNRGESFHNIGIYNGWWCSTEYNADTTYALALGMNFRSSEVWRDNLLKGAGYSVRCIKD